MSTKNCPKCKLTNPISAEICDCGFSFKQDSYKADPSAIRGLILFPQSQIGKFLFYLIFGFQITWEMNKSISKHEAPAILAFSLIAAVFGNFLLLWLVRWILVKLGVLVLKPQQ